jgi:hypothetical protein
MVIQPNPIALWRFPENAGGTAWPIALCRARRYIHQSSHRGDAPQNQRATCAPKSNV